MTEQFNPNWLAKMSAREVLAVALSLTMHQHVPDWPGATDEQLDAAAKDLLGCLLSHGYIAVRLTESDMKKLTQ